MQACMGKCVGKTHFWDKQGNLQLCALDILVKD